jgi:hypothetical protein
LIEEQLTWRSWWDEGSIKGPIHTQWQIQLRPAIHILDHNGVIRFKEIESEDVEAAINGLLGKIAQKGKA